MVQDTECRFDGVLALQRDRAFSLFVDRLDLWWTSPFREAEGQAVEGSIEPYPGGSCYEIDAKGQHRVWGTVLSIETPLYIRLAWQVSQDGQEIADPATASRVMVSFRQVGESTRLEIVHSEFLRHGERGGEYLERMREPQGWPSIVQNLQKAARTPGLR
ncbi:SRPBCC family protein [Roseibium sp. M-1]